MFTGIIQDIGIVRRVEKSGDWRIEIETRLDVAAMPPGASVACSGCCLTVVDKGGEGGARWFAVQVSVETLSCTHIGRWEQGAPVNLEPSLKVGDELGGHFVTGHVDALALVHSVEDVGESRRLRIKIPEGYGRYVAAKGGAALDGVSLTVNAVDGDLFDVNIIPHTRAHTTLGRLSSGDALHFEVDVLARYAARIADFSALGKG